MHIRKGRTRGFNWGKPCRQCNERVCVYTSEMLCQRCYTYRKQTGKDRIIPFKDWGVFCRLCEQIEDKKVSRIGVSTAMRVDPITFDDVYFTVSVCAKHRVWINLHKDTWYCTNVDVSRCDKARIKKSRYCRGHNDRHINRLMRGIA